MKSENRPVNEGADLSGYPPAIIAEASSCNEKEKLFRASHVESGSDLLSRAVSSQVPSALRGLTSVFGMGTGVTLSSLPPEIVNLFGAALRCVRPLRLATLLCFACLHCLLSLALFAAFPHPDNCTWNDSPTDRSFLPIDLFLQDLR